MKRASLTFGLVSLLLGLAILGVGCNGAVVELPTAILTPTPRPTDTPTNTPAATATATPANTPTATATPPPSSVIRLAVIGDYGSAGQAEQDVADLVQSWNPEFVITTGDNNYPSGAALTIDENIGQYYHDFIYRYTGSHGAGATTNRFFPSLGNHDWTSISCADGTCTGPYFDYFTLPGNERYYEFAWGPVDFFAIDGDFQEPDGISSTSDQAQWLQSRLASSTARWKLVYMHHPPFSSGPYGSTTGAQWPYPQWGATAVLAGHDHVYERIIEDGFPYFVNGLGGRSIYAFETPVPGSQVRYNDDYGAMLIDASDDSIIFQFISRTGKVIDIYTIGGSAGASALRGTGSNKRADLTSPKPKVNGGFQNE